MRPSDLALDFGNPVAYYPGLVKYLGSVNAVLMFCQFFYLSGKESSSLGIYKSVEEIETETGLSYREQVTARKQLASRGVLIETHKRLEHKIYFRIDADRLDEIITGNSVNSRNAQSAIGESGNSSSGIADCDNGGEAKTHFDPTETTTKNIDPPNPQEGESAGILADAKKALEFYNEQTGTRCRDIKPFALMLTPTQTREGYSLEDLQLVIRWVLATWRRRGDSLPKPANICRVNRFDGYLADAEAWATTESDIDPDAVVNGYNEIFSDALPAAELDADRRRLITRLAAHMKNKTTGAFLGYFEKFRADAPDFYFGASGWRASFDYLMKPETLRKTREGAL
ncbi:TPA: replication protein RepO [Pluralibacter gergoviae]